MSRSGFRFVHAAGLCLDEPLVGTGLLATEDRELAEEATFRAWESIVSTCIAAQAEFLILAGNSFDARTNSLRARVALEKGFETLADQQISVLISPGPQDPAAVWKKAFQLPGNVTLLNEEDHEPVAVMRDQRVVASVSVVSSSSPSDARRPVAGSHGTTRAVQPFRIGLIPVGRPVSFEDGRIASADSSTPAATAIRKAMEQHLDYIALGDGFPRTEHYAAGVVHDPGCAQALSGNVTGSRGCSVINVSSTGGVTIDPVVAAPIRWESFSLDVDRHTNWNDLAERMALLLMERKADDSERLWIVTWTLSGEGMVFESLSEPARQTELWRMVEGELRGESQVRRAHRLELMNHRRRETGTSGSLSTGLLHGFEDLLQTEGTRLFDQVLADLSAIDWMKHADSRPAREAVQGLRSADVMNQARQLAAQWLD